MASYELDFNRLTYDEFQEFYAENKDGSEKTMTEDEARRMLAKIIVKWEGTANDDLDLRIPENLGKLGVLDYVDLQKAFEQEMTSLVEDSKNSQSPSTKV